jgi:hypothetical protein
MNDEIESQVPTSYKDGIENFQIISLQRKCASLIGHRREETFGQHIGGVVETLNFADVKHFVRVPLIILVEKCIEAS